MLSYFTAQMVDATLYKYSAGSYDVDGVWVPGVESNSDIRVIAPQPLKADERVPVAEGESISDFVRIWVSTSLSVTTRRESEDPDQLLIGTNRYLAHQLDHWDEQGGFRSVVLRRM